VLIHDSFAIVNKCSFASLPFSFQPLWVHPVYDKIHSSNRLHLVLSATCLPSALCSLTTFLLPFRGSSAIISRLNTFVCDPNNCINKRTLAGIQILERVVEWKIRNFTPLGGDFTLHLGVERMNTTDLASGETTCWYLFSIKVSAFMLFTTCQVIRQAIIAYCLVQRCQQRQS
jgi:hypothetical protein